MSHQTFTYSSPNRVHSAENAFFSPAGVHVGHPARGHSVNVKRLALALAVSTGAANAAATPAYSFDAPRFACDLDEVVVERAHVLREMAEEEGLPFSEASLGALRRFVSSHGHDARPAVFLTDKGNMRAVWRTAEQEQIALEFRDQASVQFVIFAKDDDGAINRATGVVSFGGIMRQINASEAGHILRG